MQAAADHYRSLKTTSNAALAVVSISIAMLAIVFVRRKIKPGLRARNLVERVIKYILIACSTIAIFTTIGIVLSAILASLLFLSLLFISIFANGYSAFMQTFVRLTIFFDPEMLQQESLASANYQGLVKNSLRKLLLSFPIGVAAAVYLEEFAPKNRWTDLIEVNINNLAAVPSIVFGLLGLAVFLNFFGLPRDGGDSALWGPTSMISASMWFLKSTGRHGVSKAESVPEICLR